MGSDQAEVQGTGHWHGAIPDKGSRPGDKAQHGARNAAGRARPLSNRLRTEAAATLSLVPEDEMAAVPQLRK
jgi:hypothetical protein